MDAMGAPNLWMLEKIKKFASAIKICVSMIKYRICLLLEDIIDFIDPQPPIRHNYRKSYNSGY